MRAIDEAVRRHSCARRAFTEGRYRDAVRRSGELLTDLRSLTDDQSLRLRLETIRLLLDASELWWSDGGGPGPGATQEPLVDEAWQTAESLGDRHSRAIAALLRGRHLAGANGLPEAVEALASAALLAEASSDDLLLLDALTLLGHHTVGRSMEQGAGLLGRARQLAAELAARPAGDTAHWALRTAKLDCMSGVAEFDLGRFDEGERLLRQAVAGAGEAGLRDLRATSTNYLCQLLIAAGRFGEAEAALAAEIDSLGGYAAGSPHQAYNRALLGKARLEDARPAEAAEEITSAWALQSVRPHQGIATLIRNYLAELLLHRAYQGRDPVRAEQLLLESVDECRRTGYQRSEVAARCLLAEARQELGSPQEAVEHSSEAVRRLEEAGGTMPALRGEEVYYRHHAALLGAGRHREAARALGEARERILAKAGTIADPARRRTFLRAVPLNRAAFAA